MTFADKLLPRGHNARKLLRQSNSADFGSPINRCATAADFVRNRGAKARFLPRVASGEISAFALTEMKVGSDPAKMETHAEPPPDGESFILNGEKLWCTNGLRAKVVVVIAKTPPKLVSDSRRTLNQATSW